MSSAKEIEAQAASWLVKLDADPSESCRERYELWVRASPRHYVAYTRIAAAWKIADALRKHRPLDFHEDVDLLEPTKLQRRMRSK
jgi:ferric-dicitrate binding protein FerR (iron transport regulator)